MNFDYLQGRWEGFYTYGSQYPAAYRKMKVPFVLKLQIENNIVSGTCTDHYTEQYFRQPATIEGILDGNTISFIKKYPFFLGINENGQVYTDESVPASEVHYVGQLRRKLFSKRYTAQGDWDISGSFRDEKGNAMYYTNDGKWNMRQVK
jgi:hypothetical protein